MLVEYVGQGVCRKGRLAVLTRPLVPGTRWRAGDGCGAAAREPSSRTAARPRPRTDGALPSTHVVARLARCDRDESRHGSSCGASAGSGTLAGALPSVSNAFVPCITPSPDFCRTLMGESTKTIDGYL